MVQTEPLIHDGPGGPFEGTLSRPDGDMATKRPAVLVVHAFGGQSDFDTQKAEALARLGYIGFAVDLYGRGKRAASPDEARALMHTLTEDRRVLRDRMLHVLSVLKAQPGVDAAKCAAIGFCMGGKAVLDLARAGGAVQGVASFHGVLDAPALPAREIAAKVLLLHGWDDPIAKPQEVLSIAKELDAAKADWELCAYGGTGHSFTNPAANAVHSGMAYHAQSDARAWRRMTDFLAEIFT